MHLCGTLHAANTAKKEALKKEVVKKEGEEKLAKRVRTQDVTGGEE